MVQILAFSLQDQVEKYGAYIGIAAFFGLAVLTILYFAQARELRRLRDWAGRAPERAAEMEARVVAQADAARRGPAVSQPVPVPATAAAAAGGGAATASGEQATQVVDPPAETGEQAAVGSTNGTTEAAEAAPEATEHASGGNGKAAQGAKAAGIAAGAAAAAAAAAKAAGIKKDDESDEAKPAEGEKPEAEAEAAAEAKPEDAKAEDGDAAKPEEAKDEAKPGEVPVAPVPRATPLPRRAPAPAAPLRQPNRSATMPPRRAAPGTQQRKSPVTPAASNPRSIPWLLIGGAAAILVLLVVVLFVTGVIGGSDNPSPQGPSTTTTPSAGTPSQGGSSGTDALTPADTNVAVLNGTTIPGLASTEKDKLVEAGFKGKLTTGNNTDQQQADSQVLYGTRDGARTQARTIARRLDISSIGRMDADTRDLSSGADVVVILGQDKAP